VGNWRAYSGASECSRRNVRLNKAMSTCSCPECTAFLSLSASCALDSNTSGFHPEPNADLPDVGIRSREAAGEYAVLIGGKDGALH
jgi:hypothetical protein